jgi:hypothetical protein
MEAKLCSKERESANRLLTFGSAKEVGIEIQMDGPGIRWRLSLRSGLTALGLFGGRMCSWGVIASTGAGWGLTARPSAAEVKMLTGRDALLELPVRLTEASLLQHDVGELAGGIPAVRRQAGVPLLKLRSQHGFTWIVHPGSLCGNEITPSR